MGEWRKARIQLKAMILGVDGEARVDEDGNRLQSQMIHHMGRAVIRFTHQDMIRTKPTPSPSMDRGI